MNDTEPDTTVAADPADGDDAETTKLREEIALLWTLDLGGADMAVTFTPAPLRRE